MGDARYAAPDLFFGSPPSFASDLYAAGLVLYEILTGVHALPLTNADWRYTHCFTSTPPLDALLHGAPPALTSLLMTLLAKHIGERPTSAAACAATLRDLQSTLRCSAHAGAANTTTEDAVDSLLRGVAGPFSREATRDDPPTPSLLVEASLINDTYPSPPPSSGSFATGM
jgi:hypothetical protein